MQKKFRTFYRVLFKATLTLYRQTFSNYSPKNSSMQSLRLKEVLFLFLFLFIFIFLILILFQIKASNDTSNFDSYPREEEVPPDEFSGWDKEF